MENNVITKVKVQVETDNPVSLLCREAFFFGTAGMYHTETFFTHGKHELVFTNFNEDAQVSIKKNGIQVFMFCEGVTNTFASVFKTMLSYMGGLSTKSYLPLIGSHVPKYMEKENVVFLNETMGYDLVKRDVSKVEIDESLIKSGDFLAVMRLDGLDQIIMYGTGSHAGHSTMGLWFEGELYILES